MKTWSVIIFFLINYFVATAQQKSLVKTNYGLVEGFVTANKIHVFKGIPYAAPPVGENRWKAPMPLASWKGKKVCQVYGPNAMQDKPAPFRGYTVEFLPPVEPISEDCLYLNVWTNSTSKTAKKGVLVWIHGGAFMGGGSAVPIQDGEALAQKGIVLVSINYRVNAFGFLAHSELSAESPTKTSGNYGLLDQIAAIRWVKENIQNFGGDPNNITIAGQSAGSMSVNCLVSSPSAKGLFQKAIAESGACFTSGNPLVKTPTMQQEEVEGANFLKKCGVSSIKELRALPANVIVQNVKRFFAPVIDGHVLPESIPTIVTKKKDNPIILLTGWNEYEGGKKVQPSTMKAFEEAVEKQFKENSSKVLAAYAPINEQDIAVKKGKLESDVIFGLQNYSWANIHSQNGRKVYLYRFAHDIKPKGDALYGAFHTAEVPFAFDNLKFFNRNWDLQDHQLAKAMSSYWVNFVKNGNPNGTTLPTWQPYTPEKKMVMMFNEKPSPVTLPDASALDVLYSILKY